MLARRVGRSRLVSTCRPANDPPHRDSAESQTTFCRCCSSLRSALLVGKCNTTPAAVPAPGAPPTGKPTIPRNRAAPVADRGVLSSLLLGWPVGDSSVRRGWSIRHMPGRIGRLHSARHGWGRTPLPGRGLWQVPVRVRRRRRAATAPGPVDGKRTARLRCPLPSLPFRPASRRCFQPDRLVST